MKIGILTLPLYNNYGGLLQNFALQKVLVELGYDVYTINIVGKIKRRPLLMIASIAKRYAMRLLGNNVAIRTSPTNKESRIIAYNTRQFVKKNIKTTSIISQKVTQDLLEEYAFDAFIVGSDQVWRPRYSPQQSTYFLDFLEKNSSVKKISYAASFGVDNWEFSDEQTKEFRRLLKQFNSVSVREDSAVSLCQKYFNVKPIHVLDPTLLLNKEVYIGLIDNNIEVDNDNPKHLFTYILDRDIDKNIIVERISAKYELDVVSVMPKFLFKDPGKKDINDCIFPPVEDWLRGFINARFVVTDSFHGTVFAIIFNKPFITIANKDRGLTRFTSLLKMFQLEDRLIHSSEDFIPENMKNIDWKRVNAVHIREQEKSLHFIKTHLCI